MTDPQKNRLKSLSVLYVEDDEMTRSLAAGGRPLSTPC